MGAASLTLVFLDPSAWTSGMFWRHSKFAYLPVRHFVHVALPFVLEKRPVLQSKHVVAFWSAFILPLGHLEQDCSPHFIAKLAVRDTQAKCPLALAGAW